MDGTLCPVCMKALDGKGVDTVSGLIVHPHCVSRSPEQVTLRAWIALRARVARDMHHMQVALDMALAGEPHDHHMREWLKGLDK